MSKELNKETLAQGVVVAAAAVIVLPVMVAGIGAVTGSVMWAGQATTNMVKNQIDKRKKVKVEEVEED